MKFLTPLKTRYLGGKWRRVARPLEYLAADGRRFTVPVGFVCDLASVPRVPFVFAFAGDTAHEAATLHDLLYRWPLVDTRLEADLLFLEAMEATGVGRIRRRIMYRAVRIFGARAYRSEPGQLDPRGPYNRQTGENFYGGWKSCVNLPHC